MSWSQDPILHSLCMLAISSMNSLDWRQPAPCIALILPMARCTGGEAAQVGIVHNYMPFEARAGKWWLLVWWNRALAALCNHCWGNDTILDFLGTGQLNWRPLGPLLGRVSYSCPEGRPPLDWVGLNYYSRFCPVPVSCSHLCTVGITGDPLVLHLMTRCPCTVCILVAKSGNLCGRRECSLVSFLGS